MSQRERDEVKCEEKVNLCLGCSILAEFCVCVYRVLFIFKDKYLFFIKDMYRGFGEKNSALNFIFNLLC